MESSARIRIESMVTKSNMASASINRLYFELIGKRWATKAGIVARWTSAMSQSWKGRDAAKFHHHQWELIWRNVTICIGGCWSIWIPSRVRIEGASGGVESVLSYVPCRYTHSVSLDMPRVEAPPPDANHFWLARRVAWFLRNYGKNDPIFYWSPFSWKYFAEFTQLIARKFLDNAGQTLFIP